MLTHYICPTGRTIEINRCLEHCIINKKFECGRCVSLRLLQQMASQRAWSGIPSVTQLLSGTRAEFLKITKNYAASPQDMVAALFGSACHSLLERSSNDDRFICEMRLLDPTNTYSGQFDCYDKVEQTLYDTKTFGSFKVNQILGLEKIKTPIVSRVTGEQLKSERGKLLFRTSYVYGVRKMRDVTLQLNAYRIMLEHAGFPVRHMRLEVFVRDGGTWIAKDRGVSQNAFLLNVNRLPDRHVQTFFLEQAKRLVRAVNQNKIPPPCRPIETWGGAKCNGFCAVSDFCKGVV